MERIRLLLVDDEPAVRRGLRMWLETEPDVDVVGEAGDGETAIALAQELDPNVVLMDVEMPVMDGISATAALQEGPEAPAVIVLSIHDDHETRQRSQRAGASAFVAKTEIGDTLVDVIRSAAAERKGEI